MEKKLNLIKKIHNKWDIIWKFLLLSFINYQNFLLNETFAIGLCMHKKKKKSKKSENLIKKKSKIYA